MKTILLIEDQDEVRENTAEILELAGYKTLTAENGKTGVEIALKEIPDLIICDIMMPLLDGYGVLHTLSRHVETSSIPFIFLTAKTEKTDLRKGMEMGADDYITKPFDGIELLNAVDIRLKKTELLKQNIARNLKSVTEFINIASETGKIALTSDEREINTYKKKHKLYAEGHRPSYIYFLIKGKVKTYLIHDDGKEFITNIYIPNDFIGYNPVLQEINYTENAEILEDAEIMLIPRHDFLLLISSDTQIAGQFIKLLSQNVQEKEEGLINLAYNSLRKRVANGILQVLDKFRKDTPNTNFIEISRENLAHVIGSAPESLIRTLSDFKNEKMVDLKDGKVFIIDERKLRNLLF